MTNKKIFRLLSTSAILLSLASASAFAAKNGVIPAGAGTGTALTGAGTAMGLENSGAIDTNPALVSTLGNQYSAIALIANITPEFDGRQSLAGNKKQAMTNTMQYIPALFLGANYQIDDKWSVGVGVNGGADTTKYKESIFQLPPGATLIDSMSLRAFVLLMPTVSYKVSENQAYGVSALLGYSIFKTNHANPQTGKITAGSSKRDNASGLGVKVGGLWGLNEPVTFGASYTSPVEFQKFKKYQDIIPYKLSLPAIVRAGFNFTLSENFNLLLDVKHLFYQKERAFKDRMWKDQTAFIIGGKYQVTQDLTLIGGYNYARSPIRDNAVFINAFSADIVEHHFGLGALYKMSNGVSLYGAVAYSPVTKRTDNGEGPMGMLAKGARLKVKAENAVQFGVIWNY